MSFLFFGKKQEIKNDKIEQDSQEELEQDSQEESEEELEEQSIVYESLYNYNEDIMFVKMSVENLLKVNVWAYNRKLDPKHVFNIKKQIVKNKYIHGIFSVVYFTDFSENINEQGNYYLIDGQHRYKALEQIKNKHLIKDVIVNIYNVNSEEEIIKLFKDINNTKPLNPKETPNLKIISAIEKLEKDYPDAIKNGDKTVYPYLLKKNIQERLKRIKFPENKTSMDIYNCLKKLNANYGKLNINEIPNARKKLSQACINKGKTSNFYLGFDDKWSWIEEIQEMLIDD